MLTYISILKWAAGSVEPIDSKIEYDVKTLLNLVDLHSLSGKFLYRLQREKVSWVTPKLLNSLKRLQSSTMRKVNRNIKALSRLSEKLPKGKEIILIKGISTYLLTDKGETLRFGDMDILTNDYSAIIKELLGQGYKQTKAPFMHEIGEYSKNGVEFDIHDHFPVYAYPKELREADLASLKSTKVKKQNYSFTPSSISFNALKKDANGSNKLGLKNIKVVGPNLLVIIICAHSFMNFTNMWSISHRKKVCVRLGEISDLFYLTKHPQFNPKKFLSYCRQYHAWDAVKWAANMLMSIFGINPLPVEVGISKGDLIPFFLFPRCLWWTFWADIPTKTDDLLLPNWMSINKLFGYIGKNEILINNGSLVKVDSSKLQHFFTINGELIPAKLIFGNESNNLLIRLNILREKDVILDRGRIDFGSKAIEWEMAGGTKELKTTGDKGVFTYSCKKLQENYEINFRISYENLDLDKTDDISLLIGIAKHDEDGKFVASNLFPLQLKSTNKI